MSNVLELEAEIRTNIGKSAAKIYRNKGQVPGVIYGSDREPMLVAVDSKHLNMAYNKVGFKSKLIQLSIEGQPQQVMVRDVQVHPVTDIIEHADFAFIETNTPVKVLVSLKFINSDKSIGIKRGGKLNVILREIEVECLPEEAPKVIEVDLSQLNLGQKIKESHLNLPKGVTLQNKKDRIILTLQGKNKNAEPEGEAPSK